MVFGCATHVVPFSHIRFVLCYDCLMCFPKLFFKLKKTKFEKKKKSKAFVQN